MIKAHFQWTIPCIAIHLWTLFLSLPTGRCGQQQRRSERACHHPLDERLHRPNNAALPGKKMIDTFNTQQTRSNKPPSAPLLTVYMYIIRENSSAALQQPLRVYHGLDLWTLPRSTHSEFPAFMWKSEPIDAVFTWLTSALIDEPWRVWRTCLHCLFAPSRLSFLSFIVSNLCVSLLALLYIYFHCI